jgi:hypothetical protein
MAMSISTKIDMAADLVGDTGFLRIDVSGQEHTVFTGYNRPLTLTPPPADQTISTAQLGALGARAQG